jgi:hypothetical protein
VKYCVSAIGPLLAAGAKVTDFAVVEAADKRTASVLSRLLEAGGAANAKHFMGQRPALVCACESEREAVEKATLLLQYGADPNATDFSGLAALHACFRHNRLDAAEVIVDVTDDLTKRQVMRDAVREHREDFVYLLEARGVIRPPQTRR